MITCHDYQVHPVGKINFFSSRSYCDSKKLANFICNHLKAGNMKTKSTIFIVCFISLFILQEKVIAQVKTVPAGELELRFYQTRLISDALVKTYAWDSRTDVTREGKNMDILIEHCWFGNSGLPEKKVINDQEAKLPSTFLVHKVAEEVKAKMVGFMDGLHGFLEKYALRDQPSGSQFFSKARIGDIDPSGTILVSGNDILVKGDQVLWWIDSRNFALSKVSISTEFEGEKVEFSASYKYLLTGLNYLAFAEILVPGKDIIVQLHNYDYARTD
jgi:hypothetical protein